MTGRLQCDLVMRGGITSGIVYPRAIAKLAETYDFRSIGGTSAGAIAATATAAAALGATRGQDPFQTRIKSLPEDLAKRSHEGKTVLEALFQPQPSTRRLFHLLMASLAREHWLLKATRMCASLFAGYWVYALIGAGLLLIPLLAVVLSFDIAGGTLLALSATTILPTIVFALLAASIGALLDIFLQLPKNRYGLCSGSSNGYSDSAGVLPLTDWLHELFQSLAARPLDKPVTFGDLWNNGGREDAERDIELVLMTTNITRGVSHRLPFLEGGWGQLFFNEDDMAQLFPGPIVKWMKARAQPPRRKEVDVPKGCHGLPKAADLPILLGARMSLSFPFLLSAVPLYAANVVKETKEGKFPLERCWFSDGGLTSNFPIHFFDAPVPLRPTFAINLVPETVEAGEVDEVEGKLHRVSELSTPREANNHEAGWDKVWMPTKNATGIASAARFNTFTGIVGFFSAMFDTARNWADTELMAMPGYRDRIAHVKLATNEGGLNLSMPPDIITAVSKRGEHAGELLAARFAPEPGKDPKTGKDIELTWDNHRWIRYRSMMAALEVLVRRFRTTWIDAGKQKPWRSYDELLRRKRGEKPTSYPLARPGQYAFAISVTDQLVNFVAGWTTKDQTFDRGKSSSSGGAPRPKSVLRVMPPGSNDPRV